MERQKLLQQRVVQRDLKQRHGERERWGVCWIIFHYGDINNSEGVIASEELES